MAALFVSSVEMWRVTHFTGGVTLGLVTHRHFCSDWVPWRRFYFNMLAEAFPAQVKGCECQGGTTPSHLSPFTRIGAA